MNQNQGCIRIFALLGMSFFFFACVTKQVDISIPRQDRVEAAMDARYADFQNCATLNKVSGKVSLKFRLDSLAQISNTSVNSNWKNAKADDCVLSVLKSISLPPVKGEPVQIQYPLTLGERGLGVSR